MVIKNLINLSSFVYEGSTHVHQDLGPAQLKLSSTRSLQLIIKSQSSAKVLYNNQLRIFSCDMNRTASLFWKDNRSSDKIYNALFRSERDLRDVMDVIKEVLEPGDELWYDMRLQNIRDLGAITAQMLTVQKDKGSGEPLSDLQQETSREYWDQSSTINSKVHDMYLYLRAIPHFLWFYIASVFPAWTSDHGSDSYPSITRNSIDIKGLGESLTATNQSMFRVFHWFHRCENVAWKVAKILVVIYLAFLMFNFSNIGFSSDSIIVKTNCLFKIDWSYQNVLQRTSKQFTYLEVILIVAFFLFKTILNPRLREHKGALVYIVIDIITLLVEACLITSMLYGMKQHLLMVVQKNKLVQHEFHFPKTFKYIKQDCSTLYYRFQNKLI